METNNQSWEAWIVKVQKLLQEKKIIKARKMIEEVNNQVPNVPQILMLLDDINNVIKQYRQQITDLEKRHKENPDNISVLLAMVDLYIMLDELGSAWKALKKADKFKSVDHAVLMQLALAKFKLQDYKGALNIVNLTISIMNQNDPNRQAMVEFLDSTNRMIEYNNTIKGTIKLFIDRRLYKEALASLSEFDIATPDNITVLEERASVKMLLKDYNGALADYQKLIELRPNDPGYLYSLAMVKVCSGDELGAVEHLTIIIELDPKNVEVLTNLAMLNLGLKNYTLALDYLMKADHLKPNDPDILEARGQLFIVIGAYGAAKDDFQKVLSVDPNKSGLKEQLKALQPLNTADKVLREKPNDIQSLLCLGVLRRSFGDYQGALKYINKILELSPDCTEALKERAKVYFGLGVYQASITDCNKAMALKSDDQELISLMDSIEKMTIDNKNDKSQSAVEDDIEQTYIEKEWIIESSHISYSSPLLDKVIMKLSIKLDKQSRVVLGQGGFGTVYLVEYNKTPAALKQVIPDKRSEDHLKQDFHQECQLLRAIRHPNVVYFLGACLEEKNMFFLTEYMEYGDLFTLIAKKDDGISWDKHGKDIALQIAQGLTHLHANKIVHRDIKSLNILVGKGYTAKISDVGLAKTKTQTATMLTASNRHMTLLWASPEQMDMEQTVSFPTDIFSFGIVLWELLTGKKPYEGVTEKQLMMAMIKQKPIDTLNSIPINCPQLLVDLIRACWDYDPTKRPTASQCVDVLAKI